MPMLKLVSPQLHKQQGKNQSESKSKTREVRSLIFTLQQIFRHFFKAKHCGFKKKKKGSNKSHARFKIL